jgi:hypothetical protein
MGVLVLLGANMLLSSLDIPSGARTAGGELLHERLGDTMKFVALLVASLILATGAFATAPARLGERARVDARREGLTGCYNRRASYEFSRDPNEPGLTGVSRAARRTASRASTIGYGHDGR